MDQIRLYSGGKYETLQEAPAGTVCAVTGLTRTYPGEGLGIEEDSAMPVLEPVLSYQIRLPEGCDPHKMLQQLKQLEEEEPELHIVWDSALGEIHRPAHGRSTARDPETADLGTLSCGGGIRRGKHCIQRNHCRPR